MKEYRTCVVCGEEIPTSRGRSITCSKDCSAINAEDSPPVIGPSPETRKYDYRITEYERAIARLGWSQLRAAKVLGINPRTSRRYNGRDSAMPSDLQKLLRLAVYLNFAEDDFDPNLEPFEVIIRAIYKYNIGERKFLKASSTLIK